MLYYITNYGKIKIPPEAAVSRCCLHKKGGLASPASFRGCETLLLLPPDANAKGGMPYDTDGDYRIARPAGRSSLCYLSDLMGYLERDT